MILLRHGANPFPNDGGSSTVLALMDKLLEYEESKSYPYQLVSCLRIIISSIPSVEMPFKVS
jgi:ankyrin repeat and SOCS box protein 17